MKTLQWTIVEVNQEIECSIDDSGIYTDIHWTADNRIRVDVMTSQNEPVITFASDNPDALRKSLIKWLVDTEIYISTEHASYIGAEIFRCNELKYEYTQA